MQLSVFYDQVREAAAGSGLSVREVMTRCSAWGVSALEMRFGDYEAHPEQIREDLAAAGLGVSCFYDFFDYGRGEDPARGRRMLDAAFAMGVGRVLVVPGALSADEAKRLNVLGGSEAETAAFMDGNAAIQKMRAALEVLVAYAAKGHVKVTLEDFDGPVQPFARTYQLKWFMERVPGLAYTFDMGNFSFSDEDPEEAYEVLAPWVVHVHCKDRGVEPGAQGVHSQGLAACAVGDGYLPIGKMIRRLRADGYDGYLAGEHFNMKDQLTALERSAAYLSPFLN